MKRVPLWMPIAVPLGILFTGCGTLSTPVELNDDAVVQSIMQIKTALIDDKRVDAAPVCIRRVEDQIVVDGYVEREQQIQWVRETAERFDTDYPILIQLQVR